jgi:hypothetical protein
MMVRGCDGRLVPEFVVDAFTRMQASAPSYRHLMDHGTTEQSEQRALVALLKVAARCGHEEYAAFYRAPHRSDQPDDEATRIAMEHGFGPDLLIAMKAPRPFPRCRPRDGAASGATRGAAQHRGEAPGREQTKR